MSFYALSSRRSAAGSDYRLAGPVEGVFWLCLSARIHCVLLRGLVLICWYSNAAALAESRAVVGSIFQPINAV